MAFKLFTDADGKPRLDDKGVPLYIQDGATDPTPMDVNAMIDTNRQKHGAAESARKEKEELLQKLKPFEGLDPDAARKALEIAKQVEEGKLFDAGKLEELKQKYVGETAQRVQSLERALEDEKTAAQKAVEEKERMIHGLLVENAFTASGYLREKTVLPPDIAYASFGKYFEVDYQNGKPTVIAKNEKGDTLFSQSNPSAYASAEEAIKIFIEQHPQRDALLKAASPNGGSGAKAGGIAGSGTVTSRKQLKTPDDKASFIKEHGLEKYKALSND